MPDRITVILPPVLTAEKRIAEALLDYSSLAEGDGYGVGSDYGYGHGDGDGYGDGWGDGYGVGSGYGTGRGNFKSSVRIE